MKNIKKKNLPIILIGVCFLFSVLVGLFSIFNNEQQTVFADTEAESNLRFTLYNDNKEYKVAVKDRQLTEVVVPAYYNGLPVTEVADNAFMSCALLERVEIPETVQRVGNNAFYNCRNLQKLVGMINVTEIGNNAFAMCSQLSNLIIPPKVEKLGSSIIRNVTNPVYVRSTKAAIMSLNANWNLNSTAKIIYGNDLVCSQIIEDNGTVSGYSIDSWQVLMPDYDYILLCSYKYKECNGVECLDDECINVHNEKYYPITNIDKDAFNGNMFNSLTLKYDDENINTHYPVNVCSQAFMGIIADSINIEVDITLIDSSSDSEYFPESEKGTAMSVFAGSTVNSITLPDTLEKIPRSTFALCFDLKYIYNTNPYIGANTLSNKIVSIDTSAFEYCTALELLNIPNTVQYIGNAVFDYWGSTDTKQSINIDLYKSGDSWDKNWTGTLEQNVVLKFNTMPVVFEKQQGTGGSDRVEVTYGQAMPVASAPQRAGYDFDGYYSEPKGKGEKYYDQDMVSLQNWNKVSEVTILYANWIPKKYNVILADGLVVTASYGEAMPKAPVPEVSIGHHFAGYKGPNGTLYYNADMTSAHNWDILENNVKLEALEAPNVYNVILADCVIEVTYGEKMPNAPVPSVEKGHQFMGYRYNGVLYYNRDMTSAHVWDIAENNVRLDPIKSPKDYLVKLNDGKSVKATYGEPMPTAPTPLHVTGRKFMGYSYNGTLYYNADMSSAHVWDIDIDEVTLTFETVELVTNITYDLDGGINAAGNKTTLKYSETLNLQDPEKRGYKFNGWYLNGEKRTYLHNIDEENITLKARWIGHKEKLYVGDYKVNVADIEYVILELPLYFHSPCRINISENVKQVYIYSPYSDVYTYNMYIVIYGDREFNLILENFTMISQITNVSPAPSGIQASSTTLNLYTYGTVNIYGGGSANNNATGNSSNALNAVGANPGIYCRNLVIHHADNLNIYGGKGGNGGTGTTATVGGRGGDGGAALFIGKSVIISTNNVTLCGGDGGVGGKGNYGNGSNYDGANGVGGSPYKFYGSGGQFIIMSGYKVTEIHGKSGVE